MYYCMLVYAMGVGLEIRSAVHCLVYKHEPHVLTPVTSGVEFGIWEHNHHFSEVRRPHGGCAEGRRARTALKPLSRASGPRRPPWHRCGEANDR